MLKWKTTTFTVFMLMVVMLINLVLLPNPVAVASGDEYDSLRLKNYDVISGGSSFDPADPDMHRSTGIS
jgi:hypothetical protein